MDDAKLQAESVMSTDKTSGDNTEPPNDSAPFSPIEHPNPGQNPDSAQQNAQQKESKTFWLWRRKTLISLQMLFSIVLVFIYAFQVYFMREQWNTMNDQLTEMHNSSADTKALAEAAKAQAQIALDQLHSQRPYVSLGRADGIIAEYAPPAKGDKKGTVLLYFQNTGTSAATNFLTNAYSLLPPAEKGEQRHIYRARMFFKGKPAGVSFFMGDTVGAGSLRIETLDAKWVPTVDQWKQIAAGQWKAGFYISGNFEYCDAWGEYRCEMFTLKYAPAPVSKFIANTSRECPNSFVPLPDPTELAKGEDYNAQLLPRCKQPEEHTTYEEPAP
jgi:hypothetical protein